jgi:NADH-quinone oxidoreductase subunit C
MSEPPDRPEPAGEKPAGTGRSEPLAGDVSRSHTPPAAPGPRPPAAGKPAEAKTIAPPAGPVDPPPPAELATPPFVSTLQQAFPDAVTQIAYWVGDWTLIVGRDRLLDVMRHLRDAPGAQFNFCSDVTATDWPPRAERFDVIYCLYSIPLRVKVRAADGVSVPSIAPLWPAAGWLEREVFDLFGIVFDGHPDLRRILMPDEWQGHPQRKDYPLEGPGELLLESPTDWLKVKQAAEIE